ncbi:MAG: GNAT family N-acetyltransferase, partial [Minicystis sp.]
MASDLLVRPAQLADMPVVAGLAAQLVRGHHAYDPRRFLCIEPVEAGYRRWLTQELGNVEAVLLVAERGGAVVGYAYGVLEPRDWNNLLDAHGALHDVLVAESARGTGAGEALVRGVCAR